MNFTGIRYSNRYSFVILTLLAIMVADSASATVIKYIEFSTDGVLPSADPDITYIAPSGDIETDIFSVSGGIMTGYHLPGGSQVIKYAYPGELLGLYPINGGISPTEPWSVEIRARVPFSPSGSTSSSFTLWNGNRRFNIQFIETGVRVNRAGPVSILDYACDPSQWHVLKMWSENGNDFSASVDGVVFAVNQGGINDANSRNGFFLALNRHAHGAHVEWDYVRFEAGLNAVAEESATFGQIKAMYR